MSDHPFALGRLHIPDERDKQFPMSSVLPKSTGGRSYRYWWANGWWGDQGRTSQCVAYSWMHWVEDGPTTHSKTRTAGTGPLFAPADIYREAQKVDQWPGECVDTETVCLTRRGWKRHDELLIGEDILVFDMETETTRWGKLEKVHLYDGRPYRVIGHKGFEAAVTDNHKWAVNSRINGGPFTLVETQNWKSQHQFPRAMPHGLLPEKSEWSDDFVRTVAWVAAEGHYRGEGRRGNGVVVSQKVHQERVAALMERQGVAPGHRKADGCHTWEISGELAKQIRLVAPNRAPRIDWLGSLTLRQLRLFINIFVDGDGCITAAEGTRQSRSVFSQKTGPILDSTLAACVLAGQPLSRASEGDGSGGDVETWTLRRSNMVATRKLHQIETCEGRIWCPQTKYGTFVARRGKSIFITGNSYDGTSVRAGAKILMQRGVIGGYRWAWDAETVVSALLTTGPVVVGTWWYREMFYPTLDKATGKMVIRAIGGVKVGGHAYLLDGVNLNTGLVRIKNSWGRNWGDRGFAWLPIADLDMLIRDGGEACLAVEVGT